MIRDYDFYYNPPATCPYVHPLDQMEDYITVHLKEPEVMSVKEKAHTIAEMWGSTSRSMDFSKDMADNKSKNLTGLLGEYAVRKYYGLDEKKLVNDGGDGGFDMTINGSKVDVKTINYRNGDLIVDRGRYDCDVFLLVEKRDRNYGLIGGMTADRVSTYPQKGDRFPNNPYHVPRSELSKLPRREKIVEGEN